MSSQVLLFIGCASHFFINKDQKLCIKRDEMSKCIYRLRVTMMHYAHREDNAGVLARHTLKLQQATIKSQYKEAHDPNNMIKRYI